MNFEGQENKCIRVSVHTVIPGDYAVVVCKDLDSPEDSPRYVWTTVCPNWSVNLPEVGQDGFLSYSSVRAGKDKWYCPTQKQEFEYRYSANYFLNFAPITHVVLGGRVVSQQELIVT